MSANSIRNNLTKENTISEIRLCRSADIKHQLTHIIVEGIDDIRFFKNNVSNTVNLYESFSGKLGVIEIVNSFEKDDVIGVCDRDYDVGGSPNNIFYYDYSSLETMMLASFDSFKKTCNVLYPHVDDINTIYNQIFSQIRWLSAFRKINSEKAFKMNFKCVSLFKAFDREKKELCIPKLISQIAKANQTVFSKNTQILRLVAQEVKCFTDIKSDLLYANGHDVIAMFHCLCRTNNKADFDEKMIRMSLILAYNFQESALYNDLIQYANIHKLHIA